MIVLGFPHQRTPTKRRHLFEHSHAAHAAKHNGALRFEKVEVLVDGRGLFLLKFRDLPPYLVSVKRDLVRGLVSVKRDLVRGLLSVKRDLARRLVSVPWIP